jgi:hypothetical protein
MQIAGSRCFVCGKNIGVMRDGAGCVTCQIVVHKTCAGNEICPKCEKPFLTDEQVHSAQSTFLQNQLDRPVSVTALAWLAFLGVLRSAFMAVAGFLLMSNDVRAGVSTVALAALLGIVVLALGLGLLNGYEWARRLYLWGSPVAIAIGLGFGDPDLRWLRFSVAVAAYCTWAYFLTRQKAIAFFRRSERNTPA